MMLVITTSDDREQLESMSRQLVDDGLAACCQIEGPITSIYAWQGNIETAQEYRCFMKTRDDLYPKLEAEIKRQHPYDQPQIIAIPVQQAETGYRQWVDQQCRTD